jgi:outer membrane protein TolC
MESIDAQTDRLVTQRTAAVGADVGPARRGFPDAKAGDRPGMSSKTLPTTNPGAAELEYDPADPARDVQERLNRFTLEAMGGPAPAAVGGATLPPMEITLADAFSIAQRSGREYLNAEEDYILGAIRLLIERHQWEPRLSNDTSATIAGQGTDGDFQSAVTVVNDLRVTHQLPYGGQAEAAWVWSATENLREQATGRYRQSSELVLDASIPLLRGAGLRAQESLIQGERELIYQARFFEEFRRQYLVSIAKDYFSLLQSQAQIANQKRRLSSLRELEASVKAKVEAGRAQRFDLGIAENDLLSSIASLAAARDSYIAQLDAFKIRLGIPIDQPLVVKNLIFELSEPDVSLTDATGRALEFRLDLQNQRDRLDDARRGVKNARNDLLPNLSVSAGVGVPTDPRRREGGVAFSPDDANYSAGVTFGLPLDRETERLNLRAAVIGLQQQERAFSQFEDNLVLDVRSQVRAIDLARFQLRLADEQVRINQLRQEQQKIQADTTTSQERVDSANALLDALNARDDAQTRLRTAVLDYLQATGQLRVGRDGQLQPLPGMDLVPVTIFGDVPELERWYEDPPPYTGPEDPIPGAGPAVNPPPPDETIEEKVEEQAGEPAPGPDGEAIQPRDEPPPVDPPIEPEDEPRA